MPKSWYKLGCVCACVGVFIVPLGVSLPHPFDGYVAALASGMIS